MTDLNATQQRMGAMIDECVSYLERSQRAIQRVAEEFRLHPDPDAERDARLADEDIERWEAEEGDPDQEYCPVCGDPIGPGERYCSSACELRAIKQMFSEDEI